MSRTLLSLYGLTLALLGCTALPANAEDIGCSIQRFSCNAGANAEYTSLAGADGFGPTNNVVLAKSGGQAGVQSSAGYQCVSQNVKLARPSTGFRTLEITFKDISNGLANSAVRFTFENEVGEEDAVTRNFSAGQVSAPDSKGFRKVVFNVDMFEREVPDVRDSNLSKFIVYVVTKDVKSEIYFCDFKVVRANNSRYFVEGLKFNKAGCL